MKKVTIFFCMIIIYISCRPTCCGGPTGSEVIIAYVDKNGNGLFNDGQNEYFKDSVKVYDLKDGVATFIPDEYYWALGVQSSVLYINFTNKDMVNR
ncbi:MAG: hypothetical protein JST87_06725 [Bacteroidetes bacterium]|nr:hypothetical protein [Bacteroidota bacterium]